VGPFQRGKSNTIGEPRADEPRAQVINFSRSVSLGAGGREEGNLAP